VKLNACPRSWIVRALSFLFSLLLIVSAGFLIGRRGFDEDGAAWKEVLVYIESLESMREAKATDITAPCVDSLKLGRAEWAVPNVGSGLEEIESQLRTDGWKDSLEDNVATGGGLALSLSREFRGRKASIYVSADQRVLEFRLGLWPQYCWADGTI